MEILCKIRDIYRSITEFENQFQSKYGLSLNEGMLLCCVSKHKKCTSGEIAEMLNLTNSNASKVIGSIEKKGLIERVLGEKDKRQMYFSLTPLGKKHYEYIKCDTLIIPDILKEIVVS